MIKHDFTSIRKSILIFLLISGPLVYYSCDDDSPPPGPTNTDLLTADKWVAVGVSGDSASIDELVMIFTGFEITFSTGGTYSVLIPSETPPTDNGTWRFNVEETQLVLDEGTIDEQVSEVVILTETNFDFQITDVDLGIFELQTVHP